MVKCLKLGAADYLVKPLRTNELLNLWTHMWRRRRMVCFACLKFSICVLLFFRSFLDSHILSVCHFLEIKDLDA